MHGGHSGVNIEDGQGNAIIELSRIIGERDDIIGVCDFFGGDAENAIPRSARATIISDGNIEALKSFLAEREAHVREITNTPQIKICLEETDREEFYEKNIFEKIATLGSGVQIW